ncbi:MAG: nucleoside/nucleotide kinase family protein [Rhizobiaceae bacterium]|nr:nucleoside/nucleotide kinase family protein [Rhizobiaceae bacterium]
MSDLAHLAATIFRRAAGRSRFLIAVAGPPGAGKTTSAARLAALLGDAVTVPMDGFHYDNAVLDARGLRARKGAPETFDADGLVALVERLARGDRDVVAPGFDRQEDFSRAGAIVVARAIRFVVVEGNYLLLDREPWRALRPHFGLTVMLDMPKGELAHRLVRRWIDHGLDEKAARERAFGNDMANAEQVVGGSAAADIVVTLAD